MPDRYLYRCTTDKLLMHMARIEESGDEVVWPTYVGGRDWLLICRKADVIATASAQEWAVG